MDFSSAADELYGVPPADFVETRKRLVQEAKGAGDAALAKRIGALRRPTLSAWAVNLLARSAADELTGLLDVGEEMRAAWGSGRGLGDLEQRRARLVGSLVRTAGELAADAGGALREQAVREVEDTLQAATVDAGVAEEVREGRLPQPRSHSGFVPAGFPMAPEDRDERAKPEPREKPAKREPAGEKRPSGKKAEPARSNVTRTSAARARRAETLRKRAEEAEDKLAEREERADAAQREVQEASTKVGRLRHELERAIAERDAASRRADRAEQNRARAEEVAREARKAATEARRAAARDPHPGRPSSTAGRG
ncbi:hypothetical protein BJY14_008163 [Actinomadura luteofluorescens]|uniref:Uncharacterized protein n=1 Tax=Actinomadura luteofluorescens TaxID=46163 RepID=A0A7Y9JKB4_9ACTN|nr:hypothetical protein [Actinomadura luteofluorescens]NYD52180.1 hypothetical protein [Actinomadura luteofluorescens]